MPNTIRHKRGTTTPAASSLVTGEIAINTATGAAFTKTDAGTVVPLNSASPSFNGDVTASGAIVSTASAGDEGGEIRLATATTNSTLSTSVTIDVFQNRLRIFETGGTNRGAYIDLSSATAGVGSNLLAGGSAASWGSISGTLSNQTDLNNALGLKANLSGATFTGLVTTPATTASAAGLNLPHGTAPTTPNNGDVWSTSSGLFARINGSSQQVAMLGFTNTWTSGQTFTTASLTLGNSTAASTYNLGTGANGTGVTKAINIGTNGAAGSTTTITVGSTNGTTTTFNGTVNAPGLANGCKAWVNFNGTGTVAIRASSNVTSITDNGVGDYTVNFTTALADTNYILTASSYGRTGFCVGLHTAVSSWTGAPTLKSTTQARIATSYYDANLYDVNEVHVAFLR